MPNRVAKLESTVAQLSATVDGLQEELVDAHERIRALERKLEDEEADDAGGLSETASPVGFPSESSDDEVESESGTKSADDIIVA